VPSATERFPYETVNFHESAYFVLVNMCDKEGVTWDYDPLSQQIILKKDAKEVKLLIGSDVVVGNNIVTHLPGPVEIRDSVIYAPVDVRKYLIETPVCKFPVKKPGALYLRSVETVVLDAGHGGKDPGTIGIQGLKEKGVVLDMAERIKQELERCGMNVYLTRSQDRFVVLQERPSFANRKKADLFVSIHANANHSRWIEGFEVYYLTEAVDDDARALAAAENAPEGITNPSFSSSMLSLKAIIWDMIYTENRKESIELARYIGGAVSKKMGLKLLGVKGAPFAVLKGAKMPAVLVEIGYISNKEGERKLRDGEYRGRMAEAIAAGIMDFKNYSEGRK
jgi:N-acetylmuramoyl-L-alanine amidase